MTYFGFKQSVERLDLVQLCGVGGCAFTPTFRKALRISNIFFASGNVFLSYSGGRNVSDHSFYLKTGIETIKLK